MLSFLQLRFEVVVFLLFFLFRKSLITCYRYKKEQDLRALMFSCSSLYIFSERCNILVTKFCLTIGPKLMIMFHQNSTKIALNLSGHNLYLNKRTSAKINTLRKPKKLSSGKLNPCKNSKLVVDKIKYLERIIFHCYLKYRENQFTRILLGN